MNLPFVFFSLGAKYHTDGQSEFQGQEKSKLSKGSAACTGFCAAMKITTRICEVEINQYLKSCLITAGFLLN